MSNESSDQVFRNCLTKIVDLLSRRDHSVKELQQKLKQKSFDSVTIEKAIQWASERKYIRPPAELSQLLADQLLRRGKGRHYIQQYLKKRGLPPPVELDRDTELHKALEFARQKAKRSATLDRAARERIGRQLITRGFPLDIVRTVIYEKLRINEEH
jgi:regulatory protein